MRNIVTRRKFIDMGVKAGLSAPVILAGLNACNSPESRPDIQSDEKKPLNILILGGTSFLGPHQVAYAMKRGHAITTFTRGRTLPTIHQDLFDNVTSLTGDRASDLTALENGQWDAVIDNSGHNVQWARDSAALLKDRASLYLFTSSTGVFYPYLGDNIDESTAPLLTEPEDIEDEEMKLEYWYGVMKANSEIAVREEFGENRSIIVRPTYMLGPADKSNRFIHWPIRLAEGGEVLVPGKPEDPVQYVDVRDIAEWMIRLIEQQVTGTFNGVGPASAQSMDSFVQDAASVFDVNHSFVQVDDYAFLSANHLTSLVPWIMPEGNNYGSARISNDRGIDAGLTFRDIRATVQDTYDWWQTLDPSIKEKYLSDPESSINREAAILEAWQKEA